MAFAKIVKKFGEPVAVNRRCSHTNCKGKGTYQIAVVCVNCGWSGRLVLTKGHAFTRYGEPCPNCECTDLIRRMQ